MTEEKIGKCIQLASKYNVQELLIFGSVLFTSTFKDVDIGMSLGKSEIVDENQVKFTMQFELEEMFGCKVDLILLDDPFQSPLLIKSIRRKGVTVILEGTLLEESLNKLKYVPNAEYLPSLEDLEEEMSIFEDMIFQTLYKGFSCLESWESIDSEDEKLMRKHGMFMLSTALQIKEYMGKAAERISKFLSVHDLVSVLKTS